MYEIIIIMSIVVLWGNNLRIKLGLVVFIKPPLKSSPNDKMLPSFERGAIYPLKLAHKSWNHYFVSFWEFLQFEATVPQLHTFHMDSRPPSTCPTKYSNIRSLRNVAFECWAKFQINWESFAHRDQQKHMFRYV